MTSVAQILLGVSPSRMLAPSRLGEPLPERYTFVYYAKDNPGVTFSSYLEALHIDDPEDSDFWDTLRMHLWNGTATHEMLERAQRIYWGVLAVWNANTPMWHYHHRHETPP